MCTRSMFWLHTHYCHPHSPCLCAHASIMLCSGGLLSGALFQYPGAIIMTAVGVFAANLLANPSGALNGVASGTHTGRRCCCGALPKLPLDAAQVQCDTVL